MRVNKKLPIRIYDLKQMPGFNPEVTNGTDSVSSGLVSLKKWDNVGVYPSCKIHGAMNKVSPDGIWRCVQLGCNNGCYVKNL